MDAQLVALCVTGVRFRAAQAPTSPKGGRTWAPPGGWVDAHVEWQKQRTQTSGDEDFDRIGRAWLPPDRYVAAGRPEPGAMVVLGDGTERLVHHIEEWQDPYLPGVVDHYVVSFGGV